MRTIRGGLHEGIGFVVDGDECFQGVGVDGSSFKIIGEKVRGRGRRIGLGGGDEVFVGVGFVGDFQTLQREIAIGRRERIAAPDGVDEGEGAHDGNRQPQQNRHDGGVSTEE